MALTLEYLSKIGRVKRISCIMMADRGYKMPNDEHLLESMTDLQVGAKYLNIAQKAKTSFAMALSSSYVRGSESTLLVFLDLNYDEAKKREKMVSCDQIKAGIARWRQCSECQSVTFISPGKLSPDAKKEVAMPNVSVLTHDFLLFPVARHILVPPHTALTKKETEEFLTSRKLEALQLPNLKISDPIAMYYGFPVNSIIRIKRPGWDVYRVVVA